jgi:hypothetical protein
LHENFFEELGEPAKDKSRPPDLDNRPDVRRIAPIAAKYGIEVRLPSGWPAERNEVKGVWLA